MQTPATPSIHTKRQEQFGRDIQEPKVAMLKTI